jgi:hypothetical protein
MVGENQQGLVARAADQELQGTIRYVDDSQLAPIDPIDEDLPVGEVNPAGGIRRHAFAATLREHLQIFERTFRP